MSIDPVLSAVLCLSCSVLFVASALHKLRDFDRFCDAVAGYQLVPAALVVPVAAAVTLLELAAVVLFVLKPASLALRMIPAALLLLYALSIGINLYRGRRRIDCGCIGVAGRVEIHQGLVARNLVLAGLAIAAVLPTAGRPLGWVDAVSIGGGLIVLAAIFASIDGLLGQARRSTPAGVRHA